MTGKGASTSSGSGEQKGKTPESSVYGGTSVQQGVSIPITDKTNALNEEALEKAINNVTDGEITALIAKIDTTTQDAIDPALFIDLAYQGFDPLTLRLGLLAICNAHRETVEDLKNDIMWMIAIVIYMGNVQAKSLSRRNVRGRSIVNALIKKYSVKIGTINTGATALTVTFPRIVATFPALSTRMANKLPVKTYPKGPFKTFNLPGFITISSFASLLDDSLQSRTKAFLLKVVVAYSCDFSITVSEGEARKARRGKGVEVLSPVEANAQQLPYLEAATNSPVPSMKMKQTLLTEFSVTSHYDTFKSVVDNYNTLIGETSGVPTSDDFNKDISDFIALTPRKEQLR